MERYILIFTVTLFFCFIAHEIWKAYVAAQKRKQEVHLLQQQLEQEIFSPEGKTKILRILEGEEKDNAARCPKCNALSLLLDEGRVMAGKTVIKDENGIADPNDIKNAQGNVICLKCGYGYTHA